jgi:hypothetical protein
MAAVQPEPWLRALITNNNNLAVLTRVREVAKSYYVPLSVRVELVYSHRTDACGEKKNGI